MEKQTTTQTAVAIPAAPSQSERFTNMVVKEFSSNSGTTIALTEFQKRLVSNYFLSVDKSLKKAELARMEKSEAYRDPVSLTWSNVNMEQLAVDVVSSARVGLDPAQANHINMIPYKNKHTKKYDVTFIPGYRGKELVSKKYGLDVPDDIVIDLVYSNDKFRQIKKDLHNKVEGYEFEVVENFNRGTIVGGFYYYSYFEKPEKNKLRVLSMADIEKRKPEYASAEFWGGEKDEWKNGQKTGKKIAVEGWLEEMCYKTVARAAYNGITIDSQKIDDDYMKLLDHETQALPSAKDEIRENANTKTLSIDDIQTPEVVEPVTETAPPADGKLFPEDKEKEKAGF